MRTPLRIGAVMLGFLGVLLCAAAIGVGWWAAARVVERIGRAADRLSQGLAEADERLARIETKVNAVRSDLNKARVAAETIAAENPELPRIRAKIEEILDGLLSAIDRVTTIGDSLQSAATGLRTVSDIVEQFENSPEAGVRARNAASTIDRASESLGGLHDRVEALKSATAVELTRDLVTLARESVAGSERLAVGLVDARQEIAGARGRTTEWRDEFAYSATVVATINTLLWVWGGLGQLCLIDWGRRRPRTELRIATNLPDIVNE